MPDGKPTKAPLIIFGTMATMSIITVMVVFVTHGQRTEPYLSSTRQVPEHLPSNNALSLNYLSFGPPSMAYEIIGNYWWQWQDKPSDLAKSFDIKVVVYRDVGVEQLMARFPIMEAKLMDMRYVNYRDAIAYLERHLEGDIRPELKARLQSTRAKLISYFDS